MLLRAIAISVGVSSLLLAFTVAAMRSIKHRRPTDNPTVPDRHIGLLLLAGYGLAVPTTVADILIRGSIFGGAVPLPIAALVLLTGITGALGYGLVWLYTVI